MLHPSLYRSFFIALFVLLTGSLWAISSARFSGNSPTGEITLKAPPFTSIAKAEANQPATFVDEEAGIAGYIKVNQTIDLSKVDDLCRNITEQNSNYLICSIDVPDYDDNHSPTVYTHKDGWVMAYYRNTEPVSKIIDFRHYTGDAKLPTKFEQVINLVVAKIGAPSATPTYYHFAYPNAKKMMLIAEKTEPTKNDDFQINLPSGFSYYEESWSAARDDNSIYEVKYDLDGETITTIATLNDALWDYAEGLLSRNQMSDGNHTVTIFSSAYNKSAYGGLALVYSDQ